MKKIKATVLAALATMASMSAAAIGWPENYEGVMLQGFYWDSFTETSWTRLESQADELSQSFKLIWVPNSAKAASNPGMGYDPVYWFTNHNSSFGTEAELRSMISTFKAKGTGFIADVVINHRSGKSNWTDFPEETWNGKTWKIGPEGICCTDEVRNQPGQGTPTGAPDEGDDFDGSRDLDHTNANVQENCKAYVNCLLTDFGYAGCRYDMVKGYKPYYTGMYNAANDVTYSVGEYWDASYDAVAKWIDETALYGSVPTPRSAAFDFPAKYAINEAFANNDMTKLVWKANGTTNQPAGMIHFKYQRWAVTFVDNHDTYRDGSKFNGNIPAANAFIICSPGTPCVFWPHWTAYKSEIQAMIKARNAVGVHNQSKVTVLQSSSNCYMAEVTGTKGKLVVKIGSAMVSPNGYSNDQIAASGTDYCIWTSVGGDNNNNDNDNTTVTLPDNLYVMGNLSTGSWQTSGGLAMTRIDNTFRANGVTLVNSNDGSAYFTFVTAQGAKWDDVNGSDRYGAASKDEVCTPGQTSTFKKFAVNVDASSAYSWKVTPGTYNITVDFEKMTVLLSDGDEEADPLPEYWILGNLSTGHWTTNAGAGLVKGDDNCHYATFTVEAPGAKANAPAKAADGTACGYFSVVSKLGKDWDAVNSGHRYGPANENEAIELDTETPMTTYAANVNASSAKSWAIAPGNYVAKVDMNKKTITVSVNPITGITDAATEVNTAAGTEYYNLQGQRVYAPAAGLYIVRRGNKVSKEYLR